MEAPIGTIRPTGRSIMVDFGPVIDQLGAERIITPDKYKRIDNIGTIISVGEKCRILKPDDIGKKCIIGKWNRDDCRFKTSPDKEPDGKAHWQFRVPEERVEALLD